MALPKKKTSKSRKRKRRTHWKLKTPAVTICSQCGEEKMPHRACPSCGYYNNRQVLSAKEE